MRAGAARGSVAQMPANTPKMPKLMIWTKNPTMRIALAVLYSPGLLLL